MSFVLQDSLVIASRRAKIWPRLDIAAILPWPSLNSLWRIDSTPISTTMLLAVRSTRNTKPSVAYGNGHRSFSRTISGRCADRLHSAQSTVFCTLAYFDPSSTKSAQYASDPAMLFDDGSSLHWSDFDRFRITQTYLLLMYLFSSCNEVFDLCGNDATDLESLNVIALR